LDHLIDERAGVMRQVPVALVLLAAGLLAGCNPNAGAGAGSRLRIFIADITGAAKVCEVPKVDPVAGQTADVAIKVVNDGGWCGIKVHQDGPKPYGAGLLTARPAHGSVLIHVVGDDTRIDYTPDRRFTGNDSFTVRLVPGNATLQVAVTVTIATPST
jgi:hypothetical protein